MLGLFHLECGQQRDQQVAGLLQVYGQQTRLQKYCKFFRKQHTIDKFDAVINQLDEHTEKAWQLADNSISVRRRGMRASFSQGLQTLSVSTVTDSNVFDSAERAGNACAHTYKTALIVTHQLACAQKLTQLLACQVAKELSHL